MYLELYKNFTKDFMDKTVVYGQSPQIVYRQGGGLWTKPYKQQV